MLEENPVRMKEYLRLHKKNRTRTRHGITHLNRALNSALRRDEEDSAYIHVRCLLILWIAYFETSINCILHSANQLTYRERRLIVAKHSLLDKWLLLLDVCFRKYYMPTRKRNFTKLNLGATNFYRYKELKMVLQNQVGPLIEVRNRLAHGQWHIAFNNEGTDKSQDLTSHIWKLTKKDILYIKSLIYSVVSLLTELTCSRASFEKKFDNYIKRIEAAREYGQLRFNYAMKTIEITQKQKERLGYY